jgi:hypothetical protein
MMELKIILTLIILAICDNLCKVHANAISVTTELINNEDFQNCTENCDVSVEGEELNFLEKLIY